MKSVLISIQPKWCELIANGKKTVEVRKTRPKIDVPFKCYIYCTSSNVHECLMQNESGVNLIHCINYKTAISCGGEISNGKVIGEFVCDWIEEIGYSPYMHGEYISNIENLHIISCVDFSQMFDYIADGYGYGWHISDIVIYDKPKGLSEFIKPCIYGEESDVSCFLCEKSGYTPDMHIDCFNTVTRPPQSWCYVERKEGEGK